MVTTAIGTQKRHELGERLSKRQTVLTAIVAVAIHRVSDRDP